jgi:GNAT superfamily N-acetyltransferase
MDFIIRDSVQADAEAISTLVTGWAHRHLANPDLPEAAPFLASLTVAATLERMATGEFRYYVVMDKLDLCGFLAMRDKFHLYHLFVNSEYHGRGIARALWNHAKTRSGSARFIVNSSLPAVPVYERFGFVANNVAQSANGLTFVPMEYAETASNSS